MRVTAIIAFSLGCAACGQVSEESAEETQVESAPETAELALHRLVVDAPPRSLQVEAAPGLLLRIDEPAEYRISVTGSPRDPAMFVYLADELIATDDDSGDGSNAELVRFFEPGSYELRVVERRARSLTAQVGVTQLEPLEPVAALILGQASQVVFPDVPLLQRARNDRDASRALALEVASGGRFRCSAAAEGYRDAHLTLIRDGVVIAEDDDSGPGNHAEITAELEPGAFVVRVRDHRRLANMEMRVECAEEEEND